MDQAENRKEPEEEGQPTPPADQPQQPVSAVEALNNISPAPLPAHLNSADLVGPAFPGNACPICSKKFQTGTNLQWHLKTHGGYKPYKCSFCDQRYTQKGNRNVHEQKFHYFEFQYRQGEIDYETYKRLKFEREQYRPRRGRRPGSMNNAKRRRNADPFVHEPVNEAEGQQLFGPTHIVSDFPQNGRGRDSYSEEPEEGILHSQDEEEEPPRMYTPAPPGEPQDPILPDPEGQMNPELDQVLDPAHFPAHMPMITSLQLPSEEEPKKASRDFEYQVNEVYEHVEEAKIFEEREEQGYDFMLGIQARLYKEEVDRFDGGMTAYLRDPQSQLPSQPKPREESKRDHLMENLEEEDRANRKSAPDPDNLELKPHDTSDQAEPSRSYAELAAKQTALYGQMMKESQLANSGHSWQNCEKGIGGPRGEGSSHPSQRPSHPSQHLSHQTASRPSNSVSQHPNLEQGQNSYHPSQHRSLPASSHPSMHPSLRPSLHPSQHVSQLPSQHPSQHPSTHPSQHLQRQPSHHGAVHTSQINGETGTDSMPLYHPDSHHGSQINFSNASNQGTGHGETSDLTKNSKFKQSELPEISQQLRGVDGSQHGVSALLHSSASVKSGMNEPLQPSSQQPLASKFDVNNPPSEGFKAPSDKRDPFHGSPKSSIRASEIGSSVREVPRPVGTEQSESVIAQKIIVDLFSATEDSSRRLAINTDAIPGSEVQEIVERIIAENPIEGQVETKTETILKTEMKQEEEVKKQKTMEETLEDSGTWVADDSEQSVAVWEASQEVVKLEEIVPISKIKYLPRVHKAKTTEASVQTEDPMQEMTQSMWVPAEPVGKVTVATQASFHQGSRDNASGPDSLQSQHEGEQKAREDPVGSLSQLLDSQPTLTKTPMVRSQKVQPEEPLVPQPEQASQETVTERSISPRASSRAKSSMIEEGKCEESSSVEKGPAQTRRSMPSQTPLTFRKSSHRADSPRRAAARSKCSRSPNGCRTSSAPAL